MPCFLLGCNCHGHSDTCRYDKNIAERKMSLDIHGNYSGGGVCLNCRVSPHQIYYRRNIGKSNRDSQLMVKEHGF